MSSDNGRVGHAYLLIIPYLSHGQRYPQYRYAHAAALDNNCCPASASFGAIAVCGEGLQSTRAV